MSAPPYQGLGVWQIQTIRWEDDHHQKGKEWNTTIVCKDIKAVWKWLESDRNDLRTEIRAINYVAPACEVIPLLPEPEVSEPPVRHGPFFVVCHTETQLQIFCKNHHVKRRDAWRVQSEQQLHGYKNPGTLIILPGWHGERESNLLTSAPARGWVIQHASDEQVLNGTFPLPEPYQL